MNDLEDIAEYIAKDSFKYAKMTVDMLMNETTILMKNPQIGRIVPEINDHRVREIKGNYRIIYHYKADTVIVLTIHHSARDLIGHGILPAE